MKRDATLPEIKKNYLEMLKKYDPEKSPFHQDKIKEIDEAYQILVDENLRKMYDRITAEKFEQGIFSGPYQSEEEYKQHTKKGFYSQSMLAWHKTRNGINAASYISRESAKVEENGNDSEETMDFFYRRKMRRMKDVEKEEEIIKSQQTP